MQYTNPNQLKAAVVLPDLPTSCPIVTFFNCAKECMKCGRLYRNFCRWFSEKRKKGLPYSYRFTGLESKRFCWNFALLIKVLLGIANISSSINVKLHALAFSALQLRDSGSLFSRVEISREQLLELESKCQLYFNTQPLLLAILDRVQAPELENKQSQKPVKEIQFAELLHDKNVQANLLSHWAIIVSRIITKYLKAFQPH